MKPEEAALVFTDPKAYADLDRFHAACAVARRESPVHHVEAPGYNPFWAVTKFDDIMEIERQPDAWLIAPRPALAPAPQGHGTCLERPSDSFAHPDGYPGSSRLSEDQRRLVQAESIAQLYERAAELAMIPRLRSIELDGPAASVESIFVSGPKHVPIRYDFR